MAIKHTAESSDEEGFSTSPASKKSDSNRSVKWRFTQHIGNCAAVYFVALDSLVRIQVAYDPLYRQYITS